MTSRRDGGHSYVGVDGGATRTRAVVLDGQFQERARAEVGATAVDARYPERAAEVVAHLVREALAMAGAGSRTDALWVGLAGAGRETARAGVEQVLAGLDLAEHLRVGTDLDASFEDAFADRPGILVVSGTGSVALGRSERGRVARVGGWGSLLGDEGSGYAVGLEGLKRVLRDVDRRGAETQLRTALMRAIGLEDPGELVVWAHDATKGDIAGLVPVVAESARNGDAVAGEILVRAVEELEGHVLTLLETLGPWHARPSVGLGGGLLDPGGPLRRGMEAALDRHRIALVERRLDAAQGAARLAIRMATRR
jgi:glucosamine kinase